MPCGPLAKAILTFGRCPRNRVKPTIDWVRKMTDLTSVSTLAAALGVEQARRGGVVVGGPRWEVAGEDCDHPGPLVRRLVQESLLRRPIVCDGFGRPIMVRGVLDGHEESECRSDVGWRCGVEVVSWGGDGKYSASEGYLTYGDLGENFRVIVLPDGGLSFVTSYNRGTRVGWLGRMYLRCRVGVARH